MVETGSGGGHHRSRPEPVVGGEGDAMGGRGREAGVGQFDRSIDRTDLVRLRPAGRPGQDGPARPIGLWPISQ
jgi:hypothetical protein